MTLRVVSYGGGVQSTALLVLAAQGKIDYKTFLFCNVGDDSENPETLIYVHDVAMPYAQRNDIDLIELHRTFKDGTRETLYGRLTGEANRGFVIPAFYPTKDDPASGAPGKRNCTEDFKIEVVARWTKQHGATKDDPAIIGMGISFDERIRQRTNTTIAHERLAYPFIEMKIDRQQCMNIIESAGLPIPPKSSCWFCPYHSLRVWQQMRQDQPDLFQRACDLEKTLGKRQQERGLPLVWLTRKVKPLEKVTTENIQPSLFEDVDMCESGYCMM